MHVTLEFPGFLASGDIISGDTLELPHPMSVRQLLAHMGIRPVHVEHIQPFINHSPGRLDDVLSNRDHVFLYIPVGGG